MTFQALSKITRALLFASILLVHTSLLSSAFSWSATTSPRRTTTSIDFLPYPKRQSIHRDQQRHSFNDYDSALFSTTNPTSTNEENNLAMLACADTTKECFQGQNILLTGASGGLGKQLALQLAQCGAATLILSGRNEESLNALALECQGVASSTSLPLKVDVVLCDLSNRESVLSLGQEALKCCRDSASSTSKTVDVLINNGGVSSRSTFLETKLDVDERVMQINFFSGAALAKAVVPAMIEKKSGKVIWISSVQGLVGIPSRTSYAASKFAVQGYCEGLRAELAPSGVSVHVVSPGYIRTNLSKSAVTGDGKQYGKMDETTANGADPKEVAVTILDSVAMKKTDFVVAATFSAKAAIWLRLLFPGFLQSMLVKRFEKSQIQQGEEKDKDS